MAFDIKENFNLQKFNTFKINVSTKYFVEIIDSSDLHELFESDWYKENIHKLNLPIFILGGGSNILFTSDFNGLIIHIANKGIKSIFTDSTDEIIEVQAGEIWNDFVRYTVGKNLYGLTNLALIPGIVGAAPVQNIGAYGIEQDSSFVSLEAFDIFDEKFCVFTKEDCKFSYRDSIFKNEFQNRFVITSVRYKLSKIENFNVEYSDIKKYFDKNKLEMTNKNLFDSICSIRTSKLPNPELTGNCGSFFKNSIVKTELIHKIKENYPDVPIFEIDNKFSKISSAWLIEKSGFKGFSINDAGVSNMHSLVLVNNGSASGKEIFDLSQMIIDKVFSEFAILLEREVNIL